jgi:type I restriction enzyme S subunit
MKNKKQKLKWLTDPYNSICYGVVKPGENDSDGIPLIRVKDLQNGTVEDPDLKITPDLHEQYSRSEVKTDDVLISIQGTVGRVGMVPAEYDGANISRTIARIRPQNISPDYLYYCLQTPEVKSQIARTNLSSTRDSLNIEDLKNIKIPVPDKEAQLKIVENLDTEIDNIDTAIEYGNELVELLKEQKKESISRRIPDSSN